MFFAYYKPEATAANFDTELRIKELVNVFDVRYR